MHVHRLGMLVVKMVIINVSVIFFNNTCRWDTLVINMGHHQSSALWRMTQVSFLFSLLGHFIRSLHYVSFDTDTGHVITYKVFFYLVILVGLSTLCLF